MDQVAIDEEETFLRQNFSESDNRNFRDGDRESTRKYGEQPEEGEVSTRPESANMYDSPTYAKVTVDEETGQVTREIDKSSKRTSLITDEVRVYKGGSWKDRAYWLNPGARRFLDEDQSTDAIGFRCAMDRLGSQTSQQKQKGHYLHPTELIKLNSHENSYFRYYKQRYIPNGFIW